ncbi:glycoside hydrolase family 6 protein [Streptomyces sp. A7024]|uniref:Glucanase n=1 Tax=Streptomyces coryli TaxID=1128680 RepID=A0A6G4U337_9ACTN|nr:glycoside hydrolase family 6 protein [Streptomyces coryli]NGN66645.1 glycoside hydrolase family 6 protein [Streptomyces coryli]
MRVRQLLPPALTTSMAALAALLLPAAAPPAAAADADPVQLTRGFYVDPHSPPAEWARDNAGDPRAKQIQRAIAGKPMGRWFGAWDADVRGAVADHTGAAAKDNKLPLLVAYNVPGRDCGGHSGGGATSAAEYRSWIEDFAAGIGDRPALVVVEPDALPQLDECLSPDEQRERTALIRHATEQLREKAPNAWAYLDAGTAHWKPAPDMAERLDAAGLRNAHGFSINVANYYETGESGDFAREINTELRRNADYIKPYVIDTSRNGNGSNREWCNPGGRKLGPAAKTGGPGGAEMLLWVKTPGASDGRCGIAPDMDAGQFSPELAMRLIEGR